MKLNKLYLIFTLLSLTEIISIYLYTTTLEITHFQLLLIIPLLFIYLLIDKFFPYGTILRFAFLLRNSDYKKNKINYYLSNDLINSKKYDEILNIPYFSVLSSTKEKLSNDSIMITVITNNKNKIKFILKKRTLNKDLNSLYQCVISDIIY